MKYKILNTIGDFYSENAKKILENIGLVDYATLTQKDFESRIASYDIVVVGLGLNIDKRIINAGKNLKIIATATTGLDHIDVEYATEKSIEVLSLRGENEFLDTITGTAELAIGLAIDLMRKMSVSFDSVRRNEWDRERFRGRVLFRKTMGIVGFGRLGKMMTRYCKVFGMNVLFFDPHIDKTAVAQLGAVKVDFDDLLKQSDIISLHLHLTSETENMFNGSVFEKMKNGAILINTSRGQIVDEKDLLHYLNNGLIGGYAADVLSQEKNFEKNFSFDPLVEYAKSHDNVLLTPHIGGMTNDSREATDIFIANKIKSFLSSVSSSHS